MPWFPSDVEGPHIVDPIRRQLLLGAGVALLLSVLPAWADPSPGATTRLRGSRRVDVRDTGARGDGIHDDTAAIQRAIDALPGDGGTVWVPAGRYLVDPLQSIRLRSRMLLNLASGALLLAKPNAADRAYVVLAQDVSDVEIAGGAIVGERDRHLGSSGEWGHGITTRGASRVTIRDIDVSRCWGDGISIGSNPSRPGRPVAASSDVVLARVRCIGNRRQGLTIGRSHDVTVVDSEFSGTQGTPPAAGIDIEPDSNEARNIRIARCRIHDNRGPGIQVYRKVGGVGIEACTIFRNGNCGVLIVGASDTTLAGNDLRANRVAAVAVRGGANGVRIHGNRLGVAGTGSGPRPDGWRGQLHIGGDTSNVVIGENAS